MPARKIYFAALIASAALLFLPDTFISKLGLEEFRHLHRTEAGAMLIVSASLLFTSAASRVWRIVCSPFYKWQFNRMIFKTLAELTFDEKVFLTPYIHLGENTQFAEMYDGVAKGLEAKKILYRSSNISAPGGAFPYNLQPYARKILNEHQRIAWRLTGLKAWGKGLFGQLFRSLLPSTLRRKLLRHRRAWQFAAVSSRGWART